MTPPTAPPRRARTAEPAPPAAIAAAVIALIGALVLLCLAFLVLALGGLETDGAGRMWALLPLAAGVAAAVGGLRLLRRRTGSGLLGAAVVLAAVFAGVLVAQSADLGEAAPVGMVLLLLAGPVVALGLSLTRAVRTWLAAAP
jgi:hypothetical protein